MTTKAANLSGLRGWGLPGDLYAAAERRRRVRPAGISGSGELETATAVAAEAGASAVVVVGDVSVFVLRVRAAPLLASAIGLLLDLCYRTTVSGKKNQVVARINPLKLLTSHKSCLNRGRTPKSCMPNVRNTHRRMTRSFSRRTECPFRLWHGDTSPFEAR